MSKGFRDNYSKTLEELYQEELENNNHPYIAMRHAKSRLRSYANLFTRDCRKVLIKENTVCVKCASDQELVIDHIIPIAKGGRNLIENTQVLCRRCNREKSDKI